MEKIAKLKSSEKSSLNFQDYLTDGHKPPVSDAQNDCKMVEAMESGGTTTIKYHRKVDTGDSKDVAIEVNCRCSVICLLIIHIWIALLSLYKGLVQI